MNATALPYSTIETDCGEAYPYALPTDTLAESRDIRADYDHSTGHYFAPSTLRFFGSRNFQTVARGASVELQTNAPDAVGRYKVQMWRADDNGQPEPWFGCNHTTRRAATACARATSARLAAEGI